LHDAIMVVKRAVRNGEVVAGGGAIEVGFLQGRLLHHLFAEYLCRWSSQHTSGNTHYPSLANFSLS
jgi:hypothetical protein